MKKYLVRWEVAVEAEDAIHAAAKARALQLDHANPAAKEFAVFLESCSSFYTAVNLDNYVLRDSDLEELSSITCRSFDENT